MDYPFRIRRHGISEISRMRVISAVTEQLTSMPQPQPLSACSGESLTTVAVMPLAASDFLAFCANVKDGSVMIHLLMMIQIPFLPKLFQVLISIGWSCLFSSADRAASDIFEKSAIKEVGLPNGSS